MTNCLFRGNIETCLICTYYFACKARGEIPSRDEKDVASTFTQKKDEVNHESTYP